MQFLYQCLEVERILNMMEMHQIQAFVSTRNGNFIMWRDRYGKNFAQTTFWNMKIETISGGGSFSESSFENQRKSSENPKGRVQTDRPHHVGKYAEEKPLQKSRCEIVYHFRCVRHIRRRYSVQTASSDNYLACTMCVIEIRAARRQ